MSATNAPEDVETASPDAPKPAQPREINPKHIVKIATEISVNARQVIATATLLGQGSTVPFIARYRKEVTGELDEVAIQAIRDRLEQLQELDARREAILKSLTERELLTPELKTKIDFAETITTLEDIYLPFRPKRRTRATIAKEKGLEPLADRVWAANESGEALDPAAAATEFVSEEKGVKTAEEALAGARDILAERMNETPEVRARLREFYAASSTARSRAVAGKEAEGAKFKDYFDWREALASAPSHRMLAMRRGEKEGFLTLRIEPDEEEGSELLERQFAKGTGAAAEQVRLAARDCYKRLLSISMETEMRLDSKKRADAEAIRVFAENLRELLLASPLGGKMTLAVDPGFRTGCKLVVLDPQGKPLHNDVIYLEQSDRMTDHARMTMLALLERFKIEAVAIGNGTGGRESEAFIRGLGLPKSIIVVMVNESGASIYSASEVAREEFAHLDLTVRGAISIGRRLMDPLAELVKIDPKSIGVGQYQHDVDQTALKKSLDDVVISCVNGVGVEVNTASKQLLTYVSGLGPSLADNIVKRRNENGPFKSRQELLKVPRLGPKAFEQAAGFLRIRESEHPLDASAVHPESYEIVEKMAKDVGCDLGALMRDEGLRKKIKLDDYVTDKVGLPTLKDIVNELAKPGRDPRQKFEAFSFAEGVDKMEHLTSGMKLPGIVTNVTAFGAFVDIGVHQDGLVHISQLSDQFVKDPGEIVKVGQRVQVSVMAVDLPRKRIGLSMKSAPEIGPRAEREDRGAAGASGAGKSGGAPGSGQGARPAGPGGQGRPGGGGSGGHGGQGGQNRGGPPPRQTPPPPPKNNWFADALKQAEKKQK